MNASFVQARRSRRKIIHLLQKQQEVDSKAAKLLKEQFLAGHRRLLVCIAGMLNDLRSSLHVDADRGFTRNSSEDDRRLFCAVCTDFSLEEWQSLQAKETHLNVRRIVTSVLLSTAQKSYDEVAPFGFLSRLGSNEGEKVEIDKRKALRDSHALEVSSITNEINLNLLEIRERADQFLRSATSAASIACLINDSPIKDQVKEILADTSSKLSSSWKTIAEEQAISLRESQSHLDQLIGIYEQHPIESEPMLCLQDGGQDAR
jgi:hypothetical protein